MLSPSVNIDYKERMKMISDIKKIFYDTYMNDSLYKRDIHDICSEISSSIPNSSLVGINKDHNGIILSFLCDSQNVNKLDVDNIMIRIIRDFVALKSNYSFDIMSFIRFDENVKLLFRTMIIKGKSFTVII